MYTEYNILKDLHHDLGNYNFATVLSYKSFRSGWYSFMNLLELDYSEGFFCNTCGFEPQIVVMDATSLAFRKHMIKFDSAKKGCGQLLAGR